MFSFLFKILYFFNKLFFFFSMKSPKLHFLDVPSSYDIQIIIACLPFNTEKKSNFPKVFTRSDAYQIYSFHFTCSLIKIKNVEIYFMASG